MIPVEVSLAVIIIAVTVTTVLSLKFLPKDGEASSFSLPATDEVPQVEEPQAEASPDGHAVSDRRMTGRRSPD